MMTHIQDHNLEVGDHDLIIAAQAGRLDVLQRLIASGYYVNKSNFDSVTALHEACLAGRYECIEFLLQSGANVNAQNIDGATPLCEASNNGCVECVRLLLEHGARVNIAHNITTALHEAVLRDHNKVVQLLVDSGANMESQDLHYGAPLHIAAFRDYVQCAWILLRAGANVNVAKTHMTALHQAASIGSIHMVELLLDFGANVLAETTNGETALSLAPSDSQLCSLLLDHQTNPCDLQQLCRLAIRLHLTASRLDEIQHLHVPNRVKQFLGYAMNLYTKR